MPTPKPSAAHSKDATASVKSVVASLAESWNRHDMAAFAAAFCDDADFVNVIGMHWHGRQEIETKHAQTHRTIFRNSVLQIVEVTVRFLTPTIALAHARTELKAAESLREHLAPEVRRTLLTCVLMNDADRWLITAAHNTDIVPVVWPVG
ncbi:MAG: SgcJ/EcaC family oxidoreductase [Candidatus Sulfotelmatobacter sp.]